MHAGDLLEVITTSLFVLVGWKSMEFAEQDDLLQCWLNMLYSSSTTFGLVLQAIPSCHKIMNH